MWPGFAVQEQRAENCVRPRDCAVLLIDSETFDAQAVSTGSIARAESIGAVRCADGPAQNIIADTQVLADAAHMTICAPTSVPARTPHLPTASWTTPVPSFSAALPLLP
jgi:hypothetical protein